METFRKLYKAPGHVQKSFVLLSLILAMALWTTTSRTKAASTETPQLMFVQMAEDLKVDVNAKTLRLVKIGQQTLYFSDRPVRLTGHKK